MADNNSSGMTAVVAIIAILVIVVVGYFALQMINGTQPQPGINVNIPVAPDNQ